MIFFCVLLLFFPLTEEIYARNAAVVDGSAIKIEQNMCDDDVDDHMKKKSGSEI